MIVVKFLIVVITVWYYDTMFVTKCKFMWMQIIWFKKFR